MQVKRTYEHKTFGNIGSVEFTVPDGAFSLGDKVLPASSVEHLMTFALQTLQDAYAGAKDATEAKANFEKKLTKLIEGTIGTRTSGVRVDAPDWMLAFLEDNRALVKAKAQVDGYKDMTPSERDAALVAWIKAQPQTTLDRVQKTGLDIIARREESASIL